MMEPNRQGWGERGSKPVARVHGFGPPATATLLLEVVSGFLGAAIIVSSALALLPGGEGTWLSRALGHMGTILTFDFGISPVSRQPVLETVTDAAFLSFSLVAITACLLLVIAVPLGILSASRPRSRKVAFLRSCVGTASGIPILVWATLVFLGSAWGFGNPLIWGNRSAWELAWVLA